MNKKNLKWMVENVKSILLTSITEYVRTNGVPMNDYFRDEFGIEEDEDEQIVKVLDVSNPGCAYITQTGDVEEPTFYFNAVWALYIVKNNKGHEKLMSYSFVNSGTEFDDHDAQPYYDRVEELPLNELYYIICELGKPAKTCAVCGKKVYQGFLFDRKECLCSKECATKFFNGDEGCVEILAEENDRLKWHCQFGE